MDHPLPSCGMEIRAIVVLGFDIRTEVREERLVFTKLWQIDADDIVPGLARLGVQQNLLMQLVERQHG